VERTGPHGCAEAKIGRVLSPIFGKPGRDSTIGLADTISADRELYLSATSGYQQGFLLSHRWSQLHRLIINQHQQAIPQRKFMAKAYDHLLHRYGHQRDKLKFAFTQRRRSEIMVSIHRKIKTLERILGASDQVATFEQSVKVVVRPSTMNNLIGYWRHADRIYALMSSSWVCHCRQSHRAQLWLQHRTTAGFEFRMLVLFEPSDCHSSTTLPWQQHGIQIKLQGLGGRPFQQASASTSLPPRQEPLPPPTIRTQANKDDVRTKKSNSTLLR
jgi:hypothetical protein